MVVQEFGKENAETFLLLPGTSCTWEINFNMLLEPHMMQGFFETVGKTDIRSVKNQFYSDLVTKLDDGICVPGTKIHVFHSEKMGDKYLKRYHKHYEDPEIIPFPCGHEGWLGNPQLMIETFRRCMKREPNKVAEPK